MNNVSTVKGSSCVYELFERNKDFTNRINTIKFFVYREMYTRKRKKLR